MTVANNSLTGLLDRTVISHAAVVTAVSCSKWAVAYCSPERMWQLKVRTECELQFSLQISV